MTFSEYCERELGYKTKTTFWDDFSIANHWGASGVKDTFRRAFKEWRNNYEYLTELVLVLNKWSWQFAAKGNKAMTDLYVELYYKAYDWGCEHLKGKELSYFIQVLD